MAFPKCNTVFITGCSRGLGLEFVKQFLALPHPPEHLIASCRDPVNASELNQLSKAHPNLHLIQLDVNNLDSIKQAAFQVAEITKEKGLNLLINNAGLYRPLACLAKVTVEDMMECYQTNTVAPLMVTKFLLPQLKAAVKHAGTSNQYPEAIVVNISSLTASITDNKSGGIYPSRASKCAVNMVTKSLSIDLEGDGICAVAIDPGWVKTDQGGPGAKLSPEQSIAAMIKVIAALDHSKSGQYLQYSGKVLPW